VWEVLGELRVMEQQQVIVCIIAFMTLLMKQAMVERAERVT
jgi:hypothetical protein